MSHSDALLRATATANLLAIRNSQYPGRFLFQGIDDTGKYIIQGYGITVRSAPNKNRVLTHEGDCISTEKADPNQGSGDESLTLYDAMVSNEGHHVITNGSHTTLLVDDRGRFMQETLAAATYEPDLIGTARIAGMWNTAGDGTNCAEFAILKKSPWDDGCDRQYFSYEETPRGYGRFLSTYAENGNPPPPFKGEPLIVPLTGSIDQITNLFWTEIMFLEYRVTLALKFIPIAEGRHQEVRIKNERKKVT